MAKQIHSKKRMTSKMRRGGDSSSSEKVGLTRPASESRILSRPASLKSKSKSKSASLKSKSKSKSKSASLKSKSKSKSASLKSKSKSKSEDTEDKCPICFEPLAIKQTVTTECNHTFHEDCLNGWCQAKGLNVTCPTCRGDIQETCEEIGPFNSSELEIFKYICLNQWKPGSKEMARRLIANPKFDPNVRHDDESLFSYLARCLHWELLEQLLARPDLVLSAADVSEHAGSDKIRKLVIKYKKVPKSLKKLMM